MKKPIVFALLAALVVAAPQPLPAQPKDEALTPASLGKLLDKMGYEYRTSTDSANRTFYTFPLERAGVKFEVSVLLSVNREFVWITTTLAKVPDGASLPADGLLRLLQANGDLGPSVISYSKEQKSIWMGRPNDNRGVTPGILEKRIQGFVDDAVKAHKLCDFVPKP